MFDSLSLRLPDATLDYHPDWIAPELADDWLQGLLAEVAWQQPQVQVHGRLYPVPRLLAWYGEAGYRYSALEHRPQPPGPVLESIRQRVQAFTGAQFNGVLLNLYRDGSDSMGWHSDDEAVLGPQPLVASLSLGQARRFDLRRKGSSRIEHSLPLEHGSLLVMSGQTQHHWQHQVAKTRKPCAPRLNLTFRRLYPR